MQEELEIINSDWFMNESDIEDKIKKNDELFNREEFKQKTKMLFIKIQQAIMDRNLEEIRYFETEDLFEKQTNQVEEYIKNGQINIIDRVCILNSRLFMYECNDEREVLVNILESRMINYIAEDGSSRVIKGDKRAEKNKSYKLEFIRKVGIKTGPKLEGLNPLNCPNCGAPTNITLSGQCNYCGNIVNNIGWILNSIEQIKIV